jgi:hypothetical protein
MSTLTFPLTKKSPAVILWSWLLVGTLDLTAAMIQTLLAGGSIQRLFQFIASGAFGKEVFTEDWNFAVYGIIFHYIIAFIWTILFFVLYSAFNLSRFNKFIVGICYGILVWFVMNRVVLPLSNITLRPFDVIKSLIAASILIVAIGIPLSLIASRTSKNSRTA